MTAAGRSNSIVFLGLWNRGACAWHSGAERKSMTARMVVCEIYSDQSVEKISLAGWGKSFRFGEYIGILRA